MNQSIVALNANQPREAIEAAQAYLNLHPDGPDAAEAWYIIGRADETSNATQDQARQAYEQAMAHRPSPAQQADIRAGLANVAFFQGDYPKALQEWSAAYPALSDRTAKAWTLYRIGLCQQRLGRFADADPTFAMVQRDYTETPAAERAAQKSGYREFYVQVGVYENPANAWANLNALRKLGIPARIFRNTANRHVLCAGPVATYVAAQALRLRVAMKYPSAMIVP
ncbi:MAG TPA: tetratricopeptide repeat protein [Tepidisphaeraceae bacterium]